MKKELNREETELKSVWSMDTDLLKQVAPAIEGEARIIYKAHWGPNEPQIDLVDPTFVDLYRAAEQLIRESGDEHHVFIEDFEYNKWLDVWELVTGSTFYSILKIE